MPVKLRRQPNYLTQFSITVSVSVQVMSLDDVDVLDDALVLVLVDELEIVGPFRDVPHGEALGAADDLTCRAGRYPSCATVDGET